MKIFLIALLLVVASGPATARPAEMFLAGGALKICSSLSPTACRTVSPALAAGRQPTRYRIDRAGIDRALDPSLWTDTTGAPSSAALRAMLEGARQGAPDLMTDDALMDRLADACSAGNAPAACQAPGAIRPWQQLLDEERATIMAALEALAATGSRTREIVDLDASVNPHGVAILRAFVASAAERSPGRRPRVAFVTASALDPYDAVDFYTQALHAAGADPVWWPIDTAMAAAVFKENDCTALAGLRLSVLALPQRERMFPDLVAEQDAACRDPASLASLPDQVQGIFFAGGDQWRVRQAFFDHDDQPNAWLLSLRRTFAAGTLVVGGTSAGTAVQSGVAMVSNGSPERAIEAHARPNAPPPAGCERARRCPAGLREGDVTYWPAGGLALLPGWVFDTHFSQRDREPRLLRLLADAEATDGLGVDETSAVHLVRDKNGDERLTALGASGAWLMTRSATLGDASLPQAQASFLAPGRTLQRRQAGQWTLVDDPAGSCTLPARGRPESLRQAAWQLASRPASTEVRVGRVVLRRHALTRVWQGADDACGITHLTMQLDPQ